MRTISGIIGTLPTPDAALRMGQAMDPSGIRTLEQWQREDELLLAADSTGRMQPQTLRLGEENYVLLFKGRLTNLDELRWELLEEHHLLAENTPQELVLHAYAQWGRACTEHLSGSFALAVWDLRKRELFLARDPMGVQTLFYTQQEKRLIFASELRTVLACPGVSARLSREGAAELLLIGPGRTPGCGVFHGISELEPGCSALWKDGRLELKRYWSLMDGPHELDFAATSELVREMVTKAIRAQMEPEGVGAFLSGGLDSGIVCAVAAQNRETPLSTFSVDYQDSGLYFTPGKFQPSSDADFMGILEQALHTNPHHVVLTPEQLEQGLEDAVLARNLPGMGDVDISLLQLCRGVRKTVPVVLSGECADELFGGYPWYRDPEIRSRAGFPWAQSTANRVAMLQPGLLSREQAEDYIRSRYEQTVEEADVHHSADPTERRMKEMMNLNVKWFMQTLMERNRTMSGFCDLEIRSPFCDAGLAQLLYRIPWEMKDHGGTEKGLLRHAFRDLLPREILTRKKSPYPKTHDPRFLQRMQSRMAQLQEDKQAPIWALIRPEAVETLSAGESDWPFYGQLMRTPQTLCYLLQLDFWLRHYGVELLF